MWGARPRQQLEEIVSRLDLYRAIKPFSRLWSAGTRSAPLCRPNASEEHSYGMIGASLLCANVTRHLLGGCAVVRHRGTARIITASVVGHSGGIEVKSRRHHRRAISTARSLCRVGRPAKR